MQKGLFRQSKGPRKSTASSDYPLSFSDVTDSSYLYSPNIVRPSSLVTIPLLHSADIDTAV